MQQHQVGALFAVFVRTIGAARFVRAVAPVAALVAVASIPLPRAAAPIDVAHSSSGLVRMLDIAQRAANGAADSVAAHERRRQIAQASIGNRLEHADGSGSPASRIGDRWMQLRSGQRAVQRSDDASQRPVGNRLLHAAPGRASDRSATASTLDVFVLPGDALKSVASTAAARAPPGDAPEQMQDAGAVQLAAAQVARLAVEHADLAETNWLVAPSMPSPASPGIEDELPVRDSLSPLKLSPEQRNISRFVARRYRVNLDEVQRFVAHAFRAAGEFRIDPYLVLAVMSIESSFNPNARSSAGAQGLMQVLTRVHLDKFAPFGGARAALDPVANISVGSRILKEYLVREGSVEGALKSYVGAALLPHDFGYGNKVLTERARIAAAARDGVPRVQVAAQVRAATKIAMADAQRRVPGAIAPTSVAPAPPIHAGGLAPAAAAKEAKSTTEASTGSAAAVPAAVEASVADAPAVADAPSAAAPASPSLPAQASEPRASSSAALDAAASLREL